MSKHSRNSRPQQPQPPANQPPPKPIPAPMVEFIQSPMGMMAIQAVACSVSLQHFVQSLLHSAHPNVTQDEVQFLMNLGADYNQRELTSPEAVRGAANCAMGLFEQVQHLIVAASAHKTVDDILKSSPIVLPDNKAMLQRLDRGTITIVVGAPGDPTGDLEEMAPRLFKWAMFKPVGQETMQSLQEKEYPWVLRGRGDAKEPERLGGLDMMVIKNLRVVASVCVADQGASFASRLNDVTKRFSRYVDECGSAVLCFIDELDDKLVDALREIARFRVVKWDAETMGDRVFTGVEEATKLVQSIQDTARKMIEQARAAQEELETVNDQQQPQESQPDQAAAEGSSHDGSGQSSIIIP